MKLYLKKDYWYYKESCYSITYINNLEKTVKTIVHFLLNKMPVKYYYVGKPRLYEKLKQVAYQPEIRRNLTGEIQAVLPYCEKSLWGLFEQLQAHWGSDKKMVKAKTFYTEYEAKIIPTWTIYKLRREWLRKLKGYK